MFKRPFVVKSNTFIRSSDRRALLNRINGYNAETFGKTPFALAVVNLPTGETVNVYTVDKQPIFFELVPQKLMCPTVYIGWLYPKAFPTFFVPEQALVFIRNGADLMLPGVLHSEEHPLPNVEKGDPVFISVRDSANKTVIGPYAVGKTLMSTVDMFLNNMKGKGVHILHLYQDELWAFGNRDSVPSFAAKDVLDVVDKYSESEKVYTNTVDVDLAAEFNTDEVLEAFGIVLDKASIDDTPEEPEDEPESEDELLRRVFLYAVNNKIPADQKYPIDAGQFYASFILKSLPEGRRLDIKKTSWKKFTVFLNDVNSTAGEGNWFVKVSSKKGIDSITELNTKHPEVKSAKSLTPNSSEPRKPASGANGRVDITEQLSITDSSLNALKALIPKCPYRKGDLVTQSNVAKAVLDYITLQCLVKPGGKCQLDDTLSGIMTNFSNGVININDVVQKICGSMTKTYVISTPDGRTITKKTQLQSIEFKVEKRAGNKQVTLVNNLSCFGIDVKEIASKVATGVATGATVNAEAPVCVGPQLLVNGNQINYIAELLQKTYGLNKKYIKGMDLGVKTKKGGRK
uniref:SUI1 domain-containing protein n=1 Tax=Panagrellus redivivus TaxID=6233 RepID=A0A7E4VAA6_PANRE